MSYFKHKSTKFQSVEQTKQVKVICVNCEQESIITLYGFPNQYRGMVGREECPRCRAVGKLATSELAKCKVRRDNSKQVKIRWD
jgi:hypothetical protein